MKKARWRHVNTLSPGHDVMKSKLIDRMNEENYSACAIVVSRSYEEISKMAAKTIRF